MERNLEVIIVAVVTINLLLTAIGMVRLRQEVEVIMRAIKDTGSNMFTGDTRLRRSHRLVRELHRDVFEAYSKTRGQPKMSTEFLANYSQKQTELEALVGIIGDSQLTMLVEQGIMPEAPGATGDWTTQLGKKNKLVNRIHTRIYEMMDDQTQIPAPIS